MNRLMKLVISGAALIAVALVVSPLLFSPSVANQKKDDGGKNQQGSADRRAPVAQWNPARVNTSIHAGTTTQLTVTFTASSSIPATRVLLSKRLRPYVSVSPAILGAMQSGAVATLTLTISSAINATPTTTPGFLRLREAKEATSTDDAFCDGPDNDVHIAHRLPVTIDVVWPTFSGPTNGIQFSYPTYGSTATVQSDLTDFGAAGAGTIYSIAFPTSSSPTPTTQYLLSVIGNPQQYRSIRDWFIAYVDPDQLLLTSHAFVIRRLRNGVEALVLAGPIPDSFSQGPVSEVFAMSPSKLTVITIGTSNDDTMRRDLGLSSATILNGYLGILETIAVP